MSCPYADPTCPCNDGDQCHYSGERPIEYIVGGPSWGRKVSDIDTIARLERLVEQWRERACNAERQLLESLL